MAGENNEILVAIGKLTATVEALQRSIDQGNTDTNRRITESFDSLNQRLNDIQKSNDGRFSSIDKRVEHVETQQGQLTWKIASFCGLSSALTAAVIEGIKFIK